MSLFDLLREVVTALDGAGVPHMLAGSSASTYHGEPRSTQDVDVVIDPSEEALRSFLAALDDRLYVDDAVAALERRDQFNVIDPATGWKVDLVIRKDRAFSRSEFDRRTQVVIEGMLLWMATAEDTILAKLEWGRAGGSERQLRDVAGVLSVSGAALDRAYLDRWAEELGVTAELAEAERAAGA
jgi:hypothetical protein